MLREDPEISLFGEFACPNHTILMLAGVALVDDTGAHISTDLILTALTNCATLVFATVHTVPQAPIRVVALTVDETRAAEAANLNLWLNLTLDSN